MSNFDGKMKQQKKKSGGLKFMGLCFSSNESQQQPLQEQPHLQKQQYNQFQHNVQQQHFNLHRSHQQQQQVPRNTRGIASKPCLFCFV